MRKIFVVAALLISSQSHSQVFQQGNTDSSIIANEDESPFNRVLDKVVITTNKYPRKQSQTGKVVTVIDRTTIEKLGGHTLGEMLNPFASSCSL